MMTAGMKKQAFIVADPKICHGKPTFRGTRIMVQDVLEMVAEGRDWDEIIDNCDGKITREAITYAIRAASKALGNRPSRDTVAVRPLVDRDRAESRLETLLAEAEDSGVSIEMDEQTWMEIEQAGLARLQVKR